MSMSETRYTARLGEELVKTIENMQGSLEVLAKVVELLGNLDVRVQQIDERLCILERELLI